MKIVTIHQAKTHLSRLIQEALDGEEIVIAKGKTPLIQLVVHPSARPRRTPGTEKGLILHMSDDFDEPLEDFAEYS